MKVFNLYFKFVKSYYKIILGYVIIFLAIIVLFVGTGSTATSYTDTNPTVGLVNYEDSTPLVDGYLEYLENFCDFKVMKESDLPDAFFFEEIDFGIIIENGFTEGFIISGDKTIKTVGVEGNLESISFQTATNSYFNFYKSFSSNLSLSQEEIKTNVLETLSSTLTVDFKARTAKDYSECTTYFNFLAYVLIALVLNVMLLIMSSLRATDIKRRMNVSSYKTSRATFEIILGNAVCVFAGTILLSVAYFLMNSAMFSVNGLWYLLNSLCFAFPVLGIGYLLSLLIKNKNAIGAVTNVISLGQAFLCGSFVPQEYLSDGVLAVARIFPAYYYVAGNNTIGSTGSFAYENISGLLLNMGIQVLYGIALFFISFLINKKQATKEV